MKKDYFKNCKEDFTVERENLRKVLEKNLKWKKIRTGSYLILNGVVIGRFISNYNKNFNYWGELSLAGIELETLKSSTKDDIEIKEMMIEKTINWFLDIIYLENFIVEKAKREVKK